MNVEVEPCKILDWDSQFFNLRIARVEASRLDPELAQSIDHWCRQEAIDCLYLLADASHPPTIRLAEQHGFRLMEVRLTLERKLIDWKPGPIPREVGDVLIRAYQPSDLPAMQAITRNSYTTTHFVVDPCFSKERSQAFYETWVQNSCEGYEEMVLVAEEQGEVIGFLTGRFIPPPIEEDAPDCQLMLTGVTGQLRGKGVGLEMLRCGTDWFVQRGCKHIIGVVQAPNIPIQRALQRLGFVSQSAMLYYHKWFTGCQE